MQMSLTEKIQKLSTEELQDIISRASSRTGGSLAWSRRTRLAWDELSRRLQSRTKGVS